MPEKFTTLPEEMKFGKRRSDCLEAARPNLDFYWAAEEYEHVACPFSLKSDPPSHQIIFPCASITLEC